MRKRPYTALSRWRVWRGRRAGHLGAPPRSLSLAFAYNHTAPVSHARISHSIRNRTKPTSANNHQARRMAYSGSSTSTQTRRSRRTRNPRAPPRSRTSGISDCSSSVCLSVSVSAWESASGNGSEKKRIGSGRGGSGRKGSNFLLSVGGLTKTGARRCGA